MAEKTCFDRLPDRKHSDSLKWHAYDEDVLPLWVADMDFLSPEPVIRALRERVDHGVFGYPEGADTDARFLRSLRGTVSAHLFDHYHWQVEPDELVFVPGVVTGFNVVCQMLAPHSGVLVQTPVYSPILAAPGNAGLTRQEMQLLQAPDGSYEIDFDAFEGAFTPETGLFLLCNPHNPVGRVYNRQELELMAEACLRRGVLICSDEIHSDLVFDGRRHLPLAALDPEISDHTITLIAPSKTYNLAGLQCSIAIIQNRELRENFIKAGRGMVPWVNLMGLVAAEAAYREGQPWLDELLVYLEGNRDFLYDFVVSEMPSIYMAKPEGTYLAWLDCRAAEFEGNPYEFFLKQARVALNDGSAFGRGGEGFVRLNFGCPRSTLEEALCRMKTALESCQNRQPAPPSTLG